jgi:undecaprenyl-diphosphatase
VTARSRARAGAAAAALAVAALAISVVVAQSPPGAWEDDVVLELVRVPDAIGYPARAVMELGTLSAMVAVAIAAWLVGGRWRPPAAVVVAWWLAWIATNRAKLTIERPRPDEDLWRDSPGRWGYPSGHTSAAFAVATVVAALLPRRWRWVPFAVATVVAITRMHVGVHYPMDLVGGALIGLSAGLAGVALLDPGREPGEAASAGDAPDGDAPGEGATPPGPSAPG